MLRTYKIHNDAELLLLISETLPITEDDWNWVARRFGTLRDISPHPSGTAIREYFISKVQKTSSVSCARFLTSKEQILFNKIEEKRSKSNDSASLSVINESRDTLFPDSRSPSQDLLWEDIPCGAPRARSQEVYDDERPPPSIDLSSFSSDEEANFDDDIAERRSQAENEALQTLRLSMSSADEELASQEGGSYQKNSTVDLRQPLTVSNTIQINNEDIHL